MKLLVSTIISVFILSSVAFCDEVDDLSQFSESTNLNIKIILDGKYDIDKITDDLIRSKGVLNGIRTEINTKYTNSTDKNLKNKDEFERLSFIMRAYDVSLTNQLLYLKNKKSNQNNLTDAIYYFYEGNNALNQLKSSR